MTTQEITAIAAPFLSDIVPSEAASLIRGEYRLNGKTAGVYFIEYSDNSIEFDLDQFQEDNISSDYYNHPGFLQWNNYLIFIRSTDTVPLLTKNKIESNDVYTRKFVFTIEEFKKYFTYTSSTHEIETDVVSEWKEKLRTVDLDEVYSTNYYTEAVARFLSGDVHKDENIDQSLPVTEQTVLSINRISNITLRAGYREYPKPKRSFDFKTANLIHGVNGSGKTSLLTAIELVIAGKTIADPSNQESNSSIVATYNGETDSPDEYTPNNNTKYRVRDSAWYSSSYATGNELYRTFNRYNYFDSDAAYKLAFDEDNRNITKYLSAIALGPEFGRIQDRMRGFDNRLSAELRTKENSINDQQKRIEDSQKIIDAVKEVSDPQAKFDLFIATAKDIGWKSALPESLTNDTTGFEKSSQQVQALITELEDQAMRMRVSTLSEVNSQLSATTTSVGKIREAKRLVNEAIQKTGEAKAKFDEAFKDSDIISRAKIYFDNPDSFNYTTIEEDIETSSRYIRRFAHLTDEYAQISGWALLKSTDTIQNTKARFEQEFNETNEALIQQRQLFTDARESLDQINGLIVEIKSIGQRYVSINKDSTECPLCETPYSNEDLMKRIESMEKIAGDSVALKTFSDEIFRLEDILNQKKINNDQIKRIEEIFLLLIGDNTYLSMSFVDFETELKKQIELTKQRSESMSALKAKKQSLDSIGITASDLLSLKIIFENAFPIAFDISALPAFKKLLETSPGILEAAKAEHVAKQDEEASLKNALDRLRIELEIPDNESDSEKFLTFKETGLKAIQKSFNTVSLILTVGTSDSASIIRQNINRLIIAFKAYQTAREETGKMAAANLTISEASSQIGELTPVAERIKTALAVLREILTTDKEETILGDFLKNNEKDIEEIFLSLHTPKEFTGISFNYTSKTVLLQKRGTLAPVQLNKISTGQRSALALSIFLALNKKISTGPKILLFDDPVTYTDDLNILSFLDYLRNLVIKEERQIIFATANQKLAGLFEKKFGFLEEEMEVIPLVRQD